MQTASRRIIAIITSLAHVLINPSGGRMSASAMKQTPVDREASLTSVENDPERTSPEPF
jgi:hypothetical protein